MNETVAKNVRTIGHTTKRKIRNLLFASVITWVGVSVWFFYEQVYLPNAYIAIFRVFAFSAITFFVLGLLLGVGYMYKLKIAPIIAEMKH